MEHEFWHQRWANNEIGFHEGTVNQYLHDHWPELAGTRTDTVLVPLCGKSHDMWWLHDRGHPIIGVELSDIACKDFFEEAGEKAQVHPGEPFTRFRHDDLQLWCGDFLARYSMLLARLSRIRCRTTSSTCDWSTTGPPSSRCLPKCVAVTWRT